MRTGIAELLLSPVALVLPDPVTFSEIGLQHCVDGEPCTDRTPINPGDSIEDTNPLGSTHWVVARALSSTQTPIPGTTINIDVVSGPNAGDSFQGFSDANGEVKVSYVGDGGPGTDTIQASIGALLSNTVDKIWEDGQPQPEPCDFNGDGAIDLTDIRAIFGARGQTVDPAGGPGDPDANGVITINDGRACVLVMRQQ